MKIILNGSIVIDQVASVALSLSNNLLQVEMKSTESANTFEEQLIRNKTTYCRFNNTGKMFEVTTRSISVYE